MLYAVAFRNKLNECDTNVPFKNKILNEINEKQNVSNKQHKI